MKDINGIFNNDIALSDSQVMRAKNLLEIQEGTLSYFPEWGIDSKYFFNPGFEIENEVFLNYVQQKITSWGMSITSVKTVLKEFTSEIGIIFADAGSSAPLIR